jgi:hypothetical protein
MRRNDPKWILLFLFSLACCPAPGCKNEPDAPSETVLRMKTCRRLMEDSAAVVLTLWKGMNEHERELIETERDLGLEKCLRRHPDLPGRCLDFSDPQSLKRSVEVATALCMNWPEELFTCIQKRDFYGPGCRSAVDAFRETAIPPAEKKD